VNGPGDWLRANGVDISTTPELMHIAVAIGLAVLALLIGEVAGRRLGALLAARWDLRPHGRIDGLGPRLAAIAGHGIAALLLALILNGYPWKPLAALPLGLALGGCATLAVYNLLRGLHLARWMAWPAALVVFVALVSHAVGGLSAITRLLDRVGFAVGDHRFSLMALVTLVIVVVALFAAARLANRMIGHTLGRSTSLDPTQRLLTEKLAGIAIVVAAFFIGIDLLDIDLTAFAVFGGAMGLAVGFGLQKTVGNLIAGIILLMDRSIKPGDVIVVGDSFGWVNKIGVRAVSVLTRDGKEHLIPNENLMTQEVENWSYSDRKVRVRIPVGVAYSADLALTQELMLRAATESPRVLDSPRPAVQLSAFGENSVQHEIRLWITDPEDGVGSVRSDVLKRIWYLFKEHDIELPVAQRDVRIRSLPPATGAAEA
jgi:small-conductance mechanosensitive channel